MRNTNTREWKVAVLGAGTMGQCIAQFFAMNGHEVNLYNRTPANLEKAMVQIENNLNSLIGLGELNEEQKCAALEKIHGSSDLKTSVQTADFVVENLAEREDVKKDVFSKLDEYCDKDVIFASDTSTMNIFEFVEISHPERLIIAHFFNPAHVMPLVEIVKGPETADETVSAVKEFLENAGKKTAVLNKVIPGFILNRITLAVFREAAYIAGSGVASCEDIDKAIVATFGPRYTFEGPFALADFAGVDIYERLCTLLPPVLCSDTECPEIVKKLTAAQKLGVKAGEGFYEYTDEVKARRNRDQRIIKTIRAIRNIDDSMTADE